LTRKEVRNMGFGDGEDVIGYSIENMGVFCVECFEKEFGESHEILEDEIITENDRDKDEGLTFCDNCKKPI
jgi:hypothetical protein